FETCNKHAAGRSVTRSRMWKLLAVALTGCMIVPQQQGQQQVPVAAASQEPSSFGAIHRAIDEADALASTDPGAAEQKYVRARAALLKLWGEQQGGDMPNNRIMRAFGHLDSAREGSEADELMWRTFLGRSRALEALGRQEELLGEMPDHSLDG